ncbi:MAG: hypothetical protein K0S29_1017 [Gammaproteobacteria bacterium]|jgi:hypothetical protein|nr:hypothetical protein [Gammaproteobacteria bacterium]
MKRTIKVIAEMGCDAKKSLLIEMSQDMISGLKIDKDGNVDTQCLLGMLMMMEQEAALEADENAMGISEQLDLTLNIYDSSRAVNFENKALS